MRKLTVSYTGTGSRIVPVAPMIRIRGQWLIALGWKIGEQVLVEAGREVIVIRRVASTQS